MASTDSGWITLHRKILDWEWYDDTNVVRLFIHCLLKSNHKTKSWRGNTIERGQFITSQQHLSDELGLSVRQIRTALDKLKSTGEVTVKITNKFSIISIPNYDQYQGNDKQAVNEKSVKRQSNDSQVTTTNNDNNDNNDNNKDILPENLKVPMAIDFRLNETNMAWLDDSNLTGYEKSEVIKDFIDYWILDESKRTSKGWQQSFRKNPIVKRKIVNSKHQGVNSGTHQQTSKPSLAERLETNRKNALAQLEK